MSGATKITGAKVELVWADGRTATMRFKDEPNHPIRGNVWMKRDAIEVPQEEAGWTGYKVVRPGPTRGEVHLGGLIDESSEQLDDLAALRSEVERLTGQKDQLAATIAAIPDANGAANLAHARSERDKLRADVARLTRERDEARGYVDTAVEAAVQAANKRKAAEAERDSLSSQLADMIQLCDLKAAERDVALEERDELASRLAEARAKLNEVITGE